MKKFVGSLKRRRTVAFDLAEKNMPASKKIAFDPEIALLIF
jgi:hypothetical protein